MRPISSMNIGHRRRRRRSPMISTWSERTSTESCFAPGRSEEHTSELQSRSDLVCRLLLEKKKKKYNLKSRANEYTSKRMKNYMRGSQEHNEQELDVSEFFKREGIPYCTQRGISAIATVR